MNKIFTTTICLFIISVSGVLGQNTFPTTGSAGAGTNTPNTQYPLHVVGGGAMGAGWNKTLLMQATYPVVVFNSNNSRWGGIGYDNTSTSGMYFWVNSTSDDLFTHGKWALNLLNTGNSVFNGSIKINGDITNQVAISYPNNYAIRTGVANSNAYFDVGNLYVRNGNATNDAILRVMGSQAIGNSYYSLLISDIKS